MTVGELIAFNMIASQVVQPILRLSQLWQDFQQVQVSVARLGDILNAPPEPAPQNLLTLPPPRGAIEFRDVTMRYRPDAADALRNVSLSIEPGEVIGFVGPSGSGKSTLTKLIQRLYSPQSGQVMLDGVDIAQLDPGWLRRQIGVVLQENMPVQPHDPRKHRARRPRNAARDGDARGASSPARTSSSPSCRRATTR